MANTSSRQIIDAWAQPVFKEGLLPEALRLFEQSGSAQLLGQDLSAAQLVDSKVRSLSQIKALAWVRDGEEKQCAVALITLIRLAGRPDSPPSP